MNATRHTTAKLDESGDSDEPTEITDLRQLHVGDQVTNNHRSEPCTVVSVSYGEMTTLAGIEHAVRQVTLETPQGNTLKLTNQRNTHSGKVTRVVAKQGTPPKEARGLRKVGRRDPVETREAWEHHEREARR